MNTLQLAGAYPYLLARSWRAAAQLRRRGGVGGPFADFGRALGRRLLLRGYRVGAELLVRPVESVRYFEFPFVQQCLPSLPGRCLDVGSPRLFSFWVASHHGTAAIRMVNPDSRDAAMTAALVKVLGIKNLQVDACGVDVLLTMPARFDAIWSISVMEHVAGPYEDREAARWMFEALAEGGRLILTVPVDRVFREEYRDVDYYGTQPRIDGRHFFQRVYDKAAIWDRIVGTIGHEPDRAAWFGERTPGHFAAYERRWMKWDLLTTVDDPRDIAEHYASFASWEAMPGQGVCGLMFEKRVAGRG